MEKKYDIRALHQGFNHVDGEETYFIPNPGMGLWAHRSRLEN